MRNSAQLRALAVLLAAACGPHAAPAADLVSYAIVQEDATLRVRGRTVHLYGVHVPDDSRICKRLTRPPTCGTRAAVALDFRIGSHFVHCDTQWRNEDGSVTAVCRVDGEDLGAYLISRGLALARPGAPFEYTSLERLARHQGRGLWGFPADSIIRPR